jgi:hypothetical protein
MLDTTVFKCVLLVGMQKTKTECLSSKFNNIPYLTGHKVHLILMNILLEATIENVMYRLKC